MAVSRTSGFGDEVRAWLAECLPRAIVYARSLVRDAGEADDLVQECVYWLLKRAASYDLPRDGSRLLFRAVTNECIKAGLKPDVLAKLDTALQQAVANKEVSGVIGLIHRNGQRGYFEAFGWQDMQFWLDRKNNLFGVYMVQTQLYRAPTYNTFKRLANESAGIASGRAAGVFGEDSAVRGSPSAVRRSPDPALLCAGLPTPH